MANRFDFYAQDSIDVEHKRDKAEWAIVGYQIPNKFDAILIFSKIGYEQSVFEKNKPPPRNHWVFTTSFLSTQGTWKLLFFCLK